MKLYDGKIGNTYLVDSVTVDEAITRRLEALGVNEKTLVCILNKKHVYQSKQNYIISINTTIRLF